MLIHRVKYVCKGERCVKNWNLDHSLVTSLLRRQQLATKNIFLRCFKYLKILILKKDLKFLLEYIQQRNIRNYISTEGIFVAIFVYGCVLDIPGEFVFQCREVKLLGFLKVLCPDRNFLCLCSYNKPMLKITSDLGYFLIIRAFSSISPATVNRRVCRIEKRKGLNEILRSKPLRLIFHLKAQLLPG